MSTPTRGDEAYGAGSGRPVDVKMVPLDRMLRDSIRRQASRLAAGLDRMRPLTHEGLEAIASELLQRLGFSDAYLGFAMVSVSNEFWRSQFAAVPPIRRLLLLPHCMRHAAACKGTYSSLGLACGECGACPLAELKREAERLGYSVLIMEGTPAVVDIVLGGRADAILGVACLDSLEQAFDRIAQLGVPHVAVPLLVDGCAETEAELDIVQSWLRLRARPTQVRTRSYLPLVVAARRLFEDGTLNEVLGPALPGAEGRREPVGGTPDTKAIALDWLRTGGKRFRPFITLAGYAALAHGADALRAGSDLAGAFPDAVRRLAVAIEAVHKASLIHDDIEDDDLFRYGRATLHRRYGLGNAINVGDYLVGLGYKLVCAGAADLGGACVADIVNCLSSAHLRLCRGQGAELLCHGRDPRTITPVEVQSIYTLKTAPAFEAAMYAGIRPALPDAGAATIATIRSFARYLGVAYQVANDLKDWDLDVHDKLVAGQDLLSERPTILRAFLQAAGCPCDADPGMGYMSPEERIERLRRIYEEHGVFNKAHRLVGHYKERALAEAAKARPAALGELMRFVVETVL